MVSLTHPSKYLRAAGTNRDALLCVLDNNTELDSDHGFLQDFL